MAALLVNAVYLNAPFLTEDGGVVAVKRQKQLLSREHKQFLCNSLAESKAKQFRLQPHNGLSSDCKSDTTA